MSVKDVIGIFLASSGSRGDHLLFRYPHESDAEIPNNVKITTAGGGSRKNPYAVQITEDGFGHSSVKDAGVLVGFSDKVLSSLMAVKAKLCGFRFEVKIDDVVFVGCPLLLHHQSHSQPSSKKESPTIISFNVVFAVHASVDSSILTCYYELAKQLAVALRHEERRCGLLSKQKNIMWEIQDDIEALPEDSFQCPYKLMLNKSHLAQQLKLVYDELTNTGVVQLYVNKWIHVNWCLPQRFHSKCYKTLIHELRPYHGMLLLINERSLLESLPIDASPSLIRLVRVSSPFKNLQNLASDADLSLTQIYQLVVHLVYWNKATVIYPLCEANVYVLSPKTNTFVNSILAEKFMESFSGVSLPAVLADFSVPIPLGDHKDVLGLPQQQAQEVQIVCWLLRHGLLVQLHTYVFLAPQSDSDQHQTANNQNKTISFANSVEATRIRTTSSNSDITFNSDESQSISNFSAKSFEGISDIVEEWMDRPPWQLSPEQVLSLLKSTHRQSGSKVNVTDNPDDVKLLAKLSRYFNGKHHLEEIMFSENIRRSQLLMVLDKFRDILITCQHEDPGISGWGNEALMQQCD